MLFVLLFYFQSGEHWPAHDKHSNYLTTVQIGKELCSPLIMPLNLATYLADRTKHAFFKRKLEDECTYIALILFRIM